MTIENRIRQIAGRKVMVHITARRRQAIFIVRGPDDRITECASRTEALNMLLARIRCWWPGEDWKISAKPKPKS